MDEVRAVIADQGLGIVRDIGPALHTDPRDCFGVSYEFYDGTFHDLDWPLLGGTIKSAEYWRDEHPLGLTGLWGHTHAVADLDAATAFLTGFLGGEPTHDEKRIAIGGQAQVLRVADAFIELVTPDGDGPLREHLYRHGQGIASTVFGVRDIDQARRYFTERGVALFPGTADERFALDAAANCGLIFEFQETAN
jgi:catechol 2,3-dioxygenase-like lactoylglutathione lyase family enzyme